MEDYKKIFYLVKPYWKRVAVAGGASILISALNASVAWLVKPAIDDVLIKKNTDFLILLPIGVFLIIFIKGVATFINKYLMNSAAMKLVTDLRCRLYDHVIELPVGFFNRTSSGKIISTIINDINTLQGLVALTLKDLIIESVTIIALISVALWRIWDLTLIALLVLPVAFIGTNILGKRIKQITRRAREKIALIVEILHESLAGINIIKVFNKQAIESEKFKKKNKDFYRENMRAVRTLQFANLLMETASGLGITFAIWYGGKLVIDSHLTPGDFFSFLTAVFLIFNPAKKLSRVNIGIQKARPPLERIFRIFSEEKETGGIKELVTLDRSIEFKNVSFTYPSSSHKAIDNINLLIKKGSTVALVGKSGGGKTTLVNMLLRFYVPNKGNIYIDNCDIASLTLKSLRSQFGIVSQNIMLFNDTVFENIKYGRPGATREEVLEAAKVAYAHDFIMELPENYNTIIGERGAKLSGGQRQRLSLARAILKNPPILILDEATSSLDSVSEMMIQNELENLIKNRTSIVIAHRLSTIRKANIIIVLDKGRIVESGTHEELIRKGEVYSKLYEIQFGIQNIAQPID